ncbi:MAG: XRE family transcriptional regulator [Pedobacter sp.]|nr:MAG: XRE family transcriptional regulator [Pedobacter sp.]
MEESEFGDRLKAKRVAKKLSQDEVAKALGKQHRTTISNWEKGKQLPSIIELKRLAELLDTTVGHLVDGTPESEFVPKGYKLVEEDEWNLHNKQIRDLQQELISYQRKEIDRQKV